MASATVTMTGRPAAAIDMILRQLLTPDPMTGHPLSAFDRMVFLKPLIAAEHGLEKAA